MAQIHTHYDNLKVARNAPPEVIRAAYKTLAQKFHPDRNPGNADATRIMAIINASYEVLSDPDKRREHDLWVAQQERTSTHVTKPDNQTQQSNVKSHKTRTWSVGVIVRVLRNWLLYGGVAFWIWIWATDKLSTPPRPKPYQANPAPDRSEYVRPSTAPNGQPFELGKLIDLLIPKSGEIVYWDYRVDSGIDWITDGVDESRTFNGEIFSRRVGIVRVNILGSYAQVLKQKEEELPWTVELESNAPKKFGPFKINISPGSPWDRCFGSLYSGCEFNVEPSLKSANVSFSRSCESKMFSDKNIGYKVKSSEGNPAYLLVSTSAGSGGSSTSLVLAFSEGEFAELCKPGH